MTGRRLYDLICDGWAQSGEWSRSRESNNLLPAVPVAWPFLTLDERRAFTHAASKIKAAKRKP